ncbi:hypothetical protein [Methylobacterium sp. A54F]
MSATSSHAFALRGALPDAADPFVPGAARPERFGLVGRDDLVWRVRVALTEGGAPLVLSGPAGCGAGAIAAAAGEGARVRKRTVTVRCTPGLTFERFAEDLAGRLGAADLAGAALVVVRDIDRVAEPGFGRAVRILAASVPDIGWLMVEAGAAAGDGARIIPVPLLADDEIRRVVEGAAADRGIGLSRLAGLAAVTLVRGLPGLAAALVAAAAGAASAEGVTLLGLAQLRAAARTLAGPGGEAPVPALRLAAARAPRSPDGTFTRASLALELERAGGRPLGFLRRAVDPESDAALVPEGRGRLRFRDDALAARLLLGQFGWSHHGGEG